MDLKRQAEELKAHEESIRDCPLILKILIFSLLGVVFIGLIVAVLHVLLSFLEELGLREPRVWRYLSWREQLAN